MRLASIRRFVAGLGWAAAATTIATGDEDEDRSGLLVIAAYSSASTGHAYVFGSASQTELSFPDPDETPHSYYSGQGGALRQQNIVTPPHGAAQSLALPIRAPAAAPAAVRRLGTPALSVRFTASYRKGAAQ